MHCIGRFRPAEIEAGNKRLDTPTEPVSRLLKRGGGNLLLRAEISDDTDYNEHHNDSTYNEYYVDVGEFTA